MQQLLPFDLLELSISYHVADSVQDSVVVASHLHLLH